MRVRSCCALVAFGLLPILGCQASAPQFTPQDEATIRGTFDSALAQARSGDSDSSVNWSVQVLLLFQRSRRADSCPRAMRAEDREVLVGSGSTGTQPRIR